MIQGGDPTETEQVDQKRILRGEFSNNGVDNDISHTRGTISMQEPVIRTAQARSSLLFRQTVHSWTEIMQDLAMCRRHGYC